MEQRIASGDATGLRQRQLSITDVLRELSVPALDTFFDKLKEGVRSISAARLACRGLRDAIDGSVRAVRLKLRYREPLDWWLGQLPCLARLHRCSSITFTGPGLADIQLGAAGTAGLLVPLFSRLSLEARQRVTHLAIDDSNPFRHIHDSEVLVLLLVQLLPGLRTLDLHKLRSLSYQRPQLQLMYDNIRASLPHLEQLTLPDGRALQCVGALGGCLKVLDVSNGEQTIPADCFLSAMTRLHVLRRLVLRHCVFGGESSGRLLLPVLLRNLPPNLQELKLEDCCMWLDDDETEYGPAFCITVQLDAGRVSSVDLAVDEATPLQLADLAGQGLLPALGDWRQQLRSLTIASLDVEFLWRELTGAEVEQLRALRRLFPRQQLQVSTLEVGDVVPLAAVQQVVEALDEPDNLQLSLMGEPNIAVTLVLTTRRPTRRPDLDKRLEPKQQQPQPAEPQSSAPAGQGGQPLKPLLPSVADLVARVVARLVAAATEVPVAATVPSPPGGAAAAAAAEAGDGAGHIVAVKEAEDSGELLLQGPLVSMLTQGWAALEGWMKLLADRADALTGSRCISWYWELPPTGAVIVGCSLLGGVKAAVEAVMAPLRVFGPALSVYRLDPSRDLSFEVLLEQELQAAWDAAEDGGVGWQRRLEWLLGLREELRELPDHRPVPSTMSMF